MLQALLVALIATFATQANAIFLQSDWFDPTQPGVGTNRYSYSFNDPINRLDPSGNQSRGGPAQPNYSQLPQWSVNNSTITNLNNQIRLINPGYSSLLPPRETIHPNAQNRIISRLQRTLQQEQMANIIRYETLHGSVPTPRGFNSAHDAQSFMQGVNNGLRQAGYRDTIAILQGSSVTGTSYRTGEPFALNPTRSSITGLVRQSDRDVALAGGSIFQRASKLEGVRISGAGTDNARILLTESHIQSLGLQRTYKNALEQSGGTPVNFMVYQNPSAAFSRSPSYLGSE